MRSDVAYFPIYGDNRHIFEIQQREISQRQEKQAALFSNENGFSKKKDVKCLISKVLTRTYELLTKNKTHNGYLITKSRTEHSSLNRFFVLCVMEFGMVEVV